MFATSHSLFISYFSQYRLYYQLSSTSHTPIFSRAISKATQGRGFVKPSANIWLPGTHCKRMVPFLDLSLTFMECRINVLDFSRIRYAFSKLNRSLIIPKQDWHRLFHPIDISNSKALKVGDYFSHTDCHFCRHRQCNIFRFGC